MGCRVIPAQARHRDLDHTEKQGLEPKTKMSRRGRQIGRMTQRTASKQGHQDADALALGKPGVPQRDPNHIRPFEPVLCSQHQNAMHAKLA